MPPRLFALVSAFLLILAAAACGNTGDPGGTGGEHATQGTIIVGITTNLRVGVDFDTLHVVMKTGDQVVRDQVQQTTGGGDTLLALPEELHFDDLPDKTPVDVELEALQHSGSSTFSLVKRTARTEIVAGKKLLLRMIIDSRCVTAPGSSAPTCDAPETCVAGQCRDEHVDPALLKPYTSDWSSASNDPCKPSGGGAPVVIVGEGQADYLPMMDGDTAQVEAGPQGGHHIWVAVRLKNLAQSGSITEVTGHFPDLNIDVGPFDVIFTFEPDEGGYCKLYGLRFQLDQSNDITTLLGHPLDVHVKVTDPVMDVGEGTRSVVLSNDFLQ